MLCNIYTTVPKTYLKADISMPFNGLLPFLPEVAFEEGKFTF